MKKRGKLRSLAKEKNITKKDIKPEEKEEKYLRLEEKRVPSSSIEKMTLSTKDSTINISKDFQDEIDLVPDILTCGMCYKQFSLAEIVRFIQHKVQSYNKESNCLGTSLDTYPTNSVVTKKKVESDDVYNLKKLFDSKEDKDEDSYRDSGEDSEKDSDEDSDENSDEDSCEDSEKDNHEDSEKDSHEDSEKDSHEDSEKDSDEDSEKDSLEDREKDIEEDTHRASLIVTMKDAKLEEKEKKCLPAKEKQVSPSLINEIAHSDKDASVNTNEKSQVKPNMVSDILTCGVCLNKFPLTELVRFIQHKVQQCNKENNCLVSSLDSKDKDEDTNPTNSVATKKEIECDENEEKCLPLKEQKSTADLKDLFISKKYADVILKIKGEELYAHKIILALHSPVLAAMFDNETTTRKRDIITIFDYDPKVFSNFLLYLYSGELNFAECDVPELYKVADKYNVPELKSMSIDFMIRNLSVDNIFHSYLFGRKFEEKKLITAIQNYFKNNFEKIVSTEGLDSWISFMETNGCLANELLQAKEKKVKNENIPRKIRPTSGTSYFCSIICILVFVSVLILIFCTQIYG